MRARRSSIGSVRTACHRGDAGAAGFACIGGGRGLRRIVGSERNGRSHAWRTGRRSGEPAFIWLLGFTGLSGLLFYAVRDTGLTGPLLALHLGSVFALFPADALFKDGA